MWFIYNNKLQDRSKFMGKRPRITCHLLGKSLPQSAIAYKAGNISFSL